MSKTELEPPPASALQTAQSALAGAAAPPGPDEGVVRKRLVQALQHERFVWRSIDRLALETGATETQVRDVLADRPDLFTLGRGVSGRDVARLTARRPEE